MIYRSHKIALELNQSQEEYFRKAAGCARFAYNWALEEWNRQYEAGEKPNINKINAKFNKIKREKFPFVLNISKLSCQNSILNLGMAFTRFFKGTSDKPKFKKKGFSDKFQLDNHSAKIDKNKIFIPKLGWVKMCESLRLEGKIMNVSISRQANRWYASIGVEMDESQFNKTNFVEVVGIDLGIKTLATLSNGDVYHGPKSYRKSMKKLKKLQRRASKKQKDSKNRRKANDKVAKLHARISNIRKDFIHKMTTKIVGQFGTVVIENLNVKGMVKNHNLALSLSDASFGEIRRQLEYKCYAAGVNLIVADRWFPSSKTCSCCGTVKEKLPLSERTFKCECGFELDRDLNAAINLKKLAADLAVTACGETSSGFESLIQIETGSVKQEADFVLVG